MGVSNFQPEHLGRIIEATGVIPVLNQVELHPYFQQHQVRDFDDLHGIVTEAWSPIARGKVADDPVLTEIGAAHGKNAVQATLRWQIQSGIVTIPKSDHARAHRRPTSTCSTSSSPTTRWPASPPSTATSGWARTPTT